ncbi:hypothetical protein [Desulfolithobacter sp.]
MQVRNRHWLVLFLVFFGIPFFFWGGPGYHAARSFKAAWDLGHTLFFGCFSWLVFQYYQVRGKSCCGLRLFVGVFVVVLMLGIGVEFLQQGITGRNPDPCDVLRNQLGCLVAYVFFCCRKARYLALLRACVLLMLLIAAWPFCRALIDELIARKQFPVLADFETPFELARWREGRQLAFDRTLVRHGKKSMRVQLSTAMYSGTALFYFPHDWRGYRWLSLSVYNPEPGPVTLHCRIHDRWHRKSGQAFSDRFYDKFILHPGWNDLRISLEKVRFAPAEREMDMQYIESFGIFVIRRAKPMVLHVDHVYLSN